MKKPNNNSRANRNILFITYAVVALFLGLIAYFSWFLQVQSPHVINNSYNARLDLFSDRVVRGSILSNDGRVLAETNLDESGNETRNYPYRSLFAHVVGYSTKGKTGIESSGNFYLLSSHVNLLEQVFHEMTGVKNAGDHVVTTLDVDLQQAAYDALGDRRGAVIVMEPDTGRILAMVSKPDFDPNLLDEEWENLLASDNTAGQLLNRASQGLYPPGSTFKIVTALEYIRENPDSYMNFQFDCDGIYESGEYAIQCYHKTAHGHQNLEQAFSNSCNGAFAELGITLEPERWGELAAQLLFDADLPLSLVYSKSSFALGRGAGEWEILQTSIGQGATQMTPIHSAMITSAIANGGTLMRPYLIERVESAGEKTVREFLPEVSGELMTAGESADLTRFMKMAVTDGTGSAVKTEAYTVAGKTGSAEFDKNRETHAWFTGFAPVEDPQIAVTVIVEESGSGGSVAAPAARAVFDAYFSK